MSPRVQFGKKPQEEGAFSKWHSTGLSLRILYSLSTDEEGPTSALLIPINYGNP